MGAYEPDPWSRCDILQQLNTSEANLVLIETGIEKILGARRREPVTLAMLITTLSIIFIVGFTGNFLTCVVIYKNRILKTPTSYYLVTLATSDLLQLIIGVPIDIYMMYESYPWKLGKFMCKLRTVSYEFAIIVSVNTVVCFTIERYFAVCHPLLLHKSRSSKRSLGVIIGICLLSSLLVCPYLKIVDVFDSFTYHFNQSAVYRIRGPKDWMQCLNNMCPNEIPIKLSRICAMMPKYYAFSTAYTATLSVLVYVIPLLIVAILYIMIGITLTRNYGGKRIFKMATESFLENSSQLNHVQSAHRPFGKSGTLSKHRLVHILAAVVCAFFICWLPFHTQRIIGAVVHFGTIPDGSLIPNIQVQLYYLSIVFSYASGAINPILYSIMSTNFRRLMRKTLLPVCHVSN